MRQVEVSLTVPLSSAPSAMLHGYLINQVKTAPERKRPAVIICPGGGYEFRSDREGEPIALQLLAMGIHAFVLDYSVAPHRFPTALSQLAKAVACIRENHEEWRVDPQQIMVMGFSAGGHLACSLGVFWNHAFVSEAAGEQSELMKPNGMILCYPVITAAPEVAHVRSIANLLGENLTAAQKEQVSLERFVSKDTPKTFLWHTDTDQTVPMEHSLLLACALKKQNISLEYHVFPRGRHGLALATEETGGTDLTLIEPGCQSWIGLLQTWMKSFVN